MARSDTNTIWSIITLAFWRLRHTWFLLLITTLGIIAAVMIACTVPTFLTVTTTASLRSTLRDQLYSAQIDCDTVPLGLSTRALADTQKQLDPLFQRNIGKYLDGPAQLTATSTNIDSAAIQRDHELSIISTSLQNSSSHLTLIQGRLPRVTKTPGNDVEMLITPGTASSLHLHLGSILPLGFDLYTQFPDPFSPDNNDGIRRGMSFNAHVVGLFTVGTPNLDYWHGQDFEPYQQLTDPRLKKVTSYYTLLFPIEGLLGMYDGAAAMYHVQLPIIPTGTTLSWYYTVNSSHLAVTQLDDLIGGMSGLSTAVSNHFSASTEYRYTYNPNNPPPYPYITQARLTSSLIALPGTSSSLQQERTRIGVAGVPTFVLSLQILALILFFVSLMTDLLVDRQTGAIAILRSRGASQGQVFGALFAQSIALGIVAILVGLPLTLVVVVLLSQHILPDNAQDAINVITGNPVHAMTTAVGYALAVVLVVLATMSLSLARVTRMDVLSLRHDTARSTRRPLWQRLHLDVFAGIVALLGYFVSLYLTSIGTLLSSTTKALISVPLSLIAPFFLVLGCLLLFLRFFPSLLRMSASFAVKSRSAVSMLALAQMARAPRQAIRMTLLLALATAFALFSLVYTASQQQHISDIATNLVGADFGGGIATQLRSQQLSPEDAAKQYTNLPGVLSASAGFSATANIANSTFPLDIALRAVDTQTFSKTAIWPADASTQSLTSLLALLDQKRAEGISKGVVPVIVDTTIQKALAVHIGSTFTATVNTGSQDDPLLVSDLPCVVVAVVGHIPATYINQGDIESRYYVQTAGMLLDYRTYNAVYSQMAQPLGGKGKALALNYVWLRTTDNPAQLTHIRATLSKGNAFILLDVLDRRAIVDKLRADPLTITLLGVLGIGTAATLLLAVVGDLLASWLSARARLTSFAVLRALGTSPRQVASVLTWEQGLVYIFGVLLGLAFGLLLANTVSPTLITNNTGLQGSTPTQLVLPLSLLVAFIVIIGVFVLALGMMVRIVSSPSMSATLRLNED